MNKHVVRLLFFPAALMLSALPGQAQEISGFSTLSITTVMLPPSPRILHVREVEAYADTEEDYTAALYYDVSTVSAIYAGGNAAPTATAQLTGNPAAHFTYLSGKNSGLAGLKSEVTNHVADFFYIAAAGGYYDPYGFSYISSTPDGDYDSGYWFSVDAYGIYVVEASVVIGEDWDATNDSDNENAAGPNIENLMYQAFIPPDYVSGPPASSCTSVVYAGDDRINSAGSPVFMPTLGSFRAMQAISVGVGGYTSIGPYNAPPGEATGWTYQFSSAVLQNNQIPPAAYNWDYLGACSKYGINELGHVSTSGMVSPGVTYNGNNNTQTTFSGNTSNPIPLFSFPISWNVPLTLTEPTTTDLHISGTLNVTCYPAHEVSIDATDLNGGTWSPLYNSLAYITGCLTGALPHVNQPINADIKLSYITAQN